MTGNLSMIPVAVLACFGLIPGGVTGQDAGPVTFTQHVAPILYRECVGCHRPGGVGPFSLLTYDDAAERSGRMVRAVTRRVMPPWLPDSGYGVFAGARRLTADEITTIRRWVEHGRPQGPPERQPTPPPFGSDWPLGEPDLILTVPPFDVPPHPTDLYRNLVIPTPVTHRRYVTTVALHPGVTTVVHHARVMIDTTATSRVLDLQDPDPGFDGMDVVSAASNPPGFFVGWTPGKVPTPPQPGMAWPLGPGTDLVLQLHLPASRTPQVVEPRLGLYLSDEAPTRTPALVMLGSFDIDIPPGDTAYTVTDQYRLPVAASVLSLYPHAHYLGKRIEGFAELPTGEIVWLIRISAWDFNWQDEYRLAEPVTLPAGAILTMRITYDNSDSNPRNPHSPPRRVVYGSNSTDEMADLVVQIVPTRAEDIDRLQSDLDRWQAGVVASRTAHQSYEMGRVAAAEGNTDDAIAHFRESLAHQPDAPRVLNDLGLALAAAGRRDEALAHLARAAQLAPQWPVPLVHLAQGLIASARSDAERSEALAYAQRAAALTNHADPTVMDLLAVAYAETGQLHSAIAAAETALALALEQSRPVLAREIRVRLRSYRGRSEPGR